MAIAFWSMSPIKISLQQIHISQYVINIPIVHFTLSWYYTTKPQLEKKLKTLIINDTSKHIYSYKLITIAIGQWHIKTYSLVLNYHHGRNYPMACFLFCPCTCVGLSNEFLTQWMHMTNMEKKLQLVIRKFYSEPITFIENQDNI